MSICGKSGSSNVIYKTDLQPASLLSPYTPCKTFLTCTTLWLLPCLVKVVYLRNLVYWYILLIFFTNTSDHEMNRAAFRQALRIVFPGVILGLLGYGTYAYCYILCWTLYHHMGYEAGLALLIVYCILKSLVFIYWAAVVIVGPGRVSGVQPLQIFVRSLYFFLEKVGRLVFEMPSFCHFPRGSVIEGIHIAYSNLAKRACPQSCTCQDTDRSFEPCNGPLQGRFHRPRKEE